MEMQPVKDSLPEWMTQQCADSGKRNSGQLSDADKLEMCRRGARFQERVYISPEITPSTKCALCGDEGFRFFWYDGYEFAEECDCHKIAMNEAEVKRSGVSEDLTLDNFYTYQPFQQEMMNKAREYANGGYLSGQWFYVGGQVGCGKTHICTGIMRELIKKIPGCKYMMWKDESTQLKAIINDHSAYGKRMDELTKASVLYIDDLFKTQTGVKPTPADVSLAFQIVNARYQDKRKVTLFSCELSVRNIIEIDEAVGSRMYERSKGYNLFIGKDKSKNYRVKDLYGGN